MFENAQQDTFGGHTKIIAGVIVVLMAVLAVVYFSHFHGEAPATPQSAAPAAATQAANTPVPDADHGMDLSIVRNNLGRDQTQTMAMWDIQISNPSP